MKNKFNDHDDIMVHSRLTEESDPNYLVSWIENRSPRFGIDFYPKLTWNRHIKFLEEVPPEDITDASTEEEISKHEAYVTRANNAARDLYMDMRHSVPAGQVSNAGILNMLYFVARFLGDSVRAPGLSQPEPEEEKTELVEDVDDNPDIPIVEVEEEGEGEVVPVVPVDKPKTTRKTFSKKLQKKFKESASALKITRKKFYELYLRVILKAEDFGDAERIEYKKKVKQLPLIPYNGMINMWLLLAINFNKEPNADTFKEFGFLAKTSIHKWVKRNLILKSVKIDFMKNYGFYANYALFVYYLYRALSYDLFGVELTSFAYVSKLSTISNMQKLVTNAAKQAVTKYTSLWNLLKPSDTEERTITGSLLTNDESTLKTLIFKNEGTMTTDISEKLRSLTMWENKTVNLSSDSNDLTQMEEHIKISLTIFTNIHGT